MNMILSALLKPPSLKGMKKVICIQPHPDDNEVGMGGAIKKFSDNGCEVHYITVTDGSLGLTDPNMTHDELVKVRKIECEESGRLLGVEHFHYLEHRDGTLSDINKLTGELCELVRAIKPEFIFCPDPWLTYEAHQDHIVAGKAAAQCMALSGLLEYPLGTKTLPHKLKGVGFYYTNKPNTVVNITDTFSLKIKAIAKHKSQFDKNTLSLFKIYFKELAKDSAKSKKFKLGCGLKVLGENHLHCFVNAENI